MEHLHDRVARKKRQLDNEMIEGVTAQIELEKTAESFRRTHQEREELIEQWEQTINQMRKRDHDMLKCADVSWSDVIMCIIEILSSLLLGNGETEN